MPRSGVAIPVDPGEYCAAANSSLLYRVAHGSCAKRHAIRAERVGHDMSQGYVLTQYFYTQLGPFERTPASLKESIGEMVYGMDVPQELGQLKNIHFVEEGSADIVRRTPLEAARSGPGGDRPGEGRSEDGCRSLRDSPQAAHCRASSCEFYPRPRRPDEREDRRR